MSSTVFIIFAASSLMSREIKMFSLPNATYLEEDCSDETSLTEPLCEPWVFTLLTPPHYKEGYH